MVEVEQGLFDLATKKAGAIELNRG
jgi:hypothetical protein